MICLKMQTRALENRPSVRTNVNISYIISSSTTHGEFCFSHDLYDVVALHLITLYHCHFSILSTVTSFGIQSEAKLIFLCLSI